MAQAWAFLKGRDFVTPDDILDVAAPVLELRLVGDVGQVKRIIDEIIGSVRVPT